MIFFLITLAALTLSVPTRADFYYPDCSSAGTSCLDCNTQKYCIDFFGLIRWSTTTCPTNTPYCEPTTNACTNVLPSDCTSQTSNKCLRDDGAFPDLTECSSYYQCTNNTINELECPDQYVYKQAWGKCVYDLSNGNCAVLTCTSTNLVAAYPGDSSLYYTCSGGTLKLSACSETEQFNQATNACIGICASPGSISNPRNCEMYFSCQNSTGTLAATEITCNSGTGFNPSSGRCESGYQTLCNELALLDNDISNLALSIPVVGTLWAPFKSLLNLLNFNPLTFISWIGVSDSYKSTGILILDYLYKNKALPSSIVTIAVKAILPYLPDQIRSVIETMLQLGILNLNVNSKQSDDLVGLYLQDAITNFSLDSASDLQGKTSSEVLTQFFGIPEPQVPMVVQLIRLQLPAVAKSLNEHVGVDLFKVDGGNALIIDINTVDDVIYNILNEIGQRLYPTNRFLSEIFKAYSGQMYQLHHVAVVDAVDAFQLSFDKL